MGRSANPDAALAAALRSLRIERKLTQEAVAFRAGVTTGSVARLELAQSVPGWDTVRQIAAALGVSLRELAAAVEAEELPR
jgi:transcriptional regulator with XRE-family HTH domain